MKTFEVPESPCPYCGAQQDHAAPADGFDLKPEPGDISLCYDCGEVLRFAQDLSLTRMDRAAWAALSDDEVAAIVQLQNAHAAMKQRKQKHRL